MLSDHSLIIGQLEATSLVGVDQVLCVRRRRWRSFDINAFSQDLQHKVSLLMQSPAPAPECEVDELFSSYDQLMRALLDKHAPMTSVRTKRQQQAAPWYADDCRAAKSSLRNLVKPLYTTANS
jgi:malate synthase